MSGELAKVYNPKDVEKKIYQMWLEAGAFDAEASDPRRTFCIVIPPPNVTDVLHLGHALNNSLQDVIVRYKRMCQLNTLWMPGTDHAGIATQTVVEKRLLSEEGRRRTDFSREEFVARVQKWKDQYEARILEQLKLMGCSCDWRRTRFTMDEVCARAVREAFFRLFADGVIYRGKRLVNWDPATQTVLADDEVEHETVHGHFWYLRYPLVEPVEIDGRTVEYVTVATTRPETMLGDTAVAINPADPRAKALVGREVRLPIVGRIIPIIADDLVVLPNPDSQDEKARFSTGFLKVTPAHDPNDWEIGQRHGLPVINVMAPDGTISDKYGWDDAKGTDAEQLLGMDRFEARQAVVEWFRSENLLADVRQYVHEVGHSYRSHVPIEPYLSDQWYIAVKQPIDRLAGQFGTGLIEGTDVPVNSKAGWKISATGPSADSSGGDTGYPCGISIWTSPRLTTARGPSKRSRGNTSRPFRPSFASSPSKPRFPTGLDLSGLLRSPRWPICVRRTPRPIRSWSRFKPRLAAAGKMPRGAWGNTSRGLTATRTFWTRGSPRRSGRSRRWAGLPTARTCAATTPETSSAPPGRLSRCGSRGW